MKSRYLSMVNTAEAVYEAYRCHTLRDSNSKYRGGIDMGQTYLIEPNSAPGIINNACVLYGCPESRYYRDEKVLYDIVSACEMMLRLLHDDGTIDFLATNFYTPATFEIQTICNGYASFKASLRGTDAEMRCDGVLRRLMERLGEGCLNGGFHTPNHRWVEASSLYMLANIFDRDDFRAKADRYLSEGIDCDEYGEFTERSVGCYNAVNCNSLLIMAEEAGKPELYEYVKKNLELTFDYLDSDGTLFTKNSRRQDSGTLRFYPAHTWYYIYLWAGWLFDNKKYLKFAEEMIKTNLANGLGIPGCLWLYQKYPALKNLDPDLSDVEIPERYTAFYPKSGILRMRKDAFSVTFVSGKPDFMYLKFGKAEMNVRMCSSFFAVAQFAPEMIEKTQDGYRMCFRGHGEYKGQFAVPPETNEWYQMDHSLRPVLHSCDLDYTLDIHLEEDGVRLNIEVSNTPHVPFKLELSVPAGTRIETDEVMTDAVAGGYMAVRKGDVLLEDLKTGAVVTVKGLFAKHLYHRNMRGSVPPHEDMFAIYATDYSPLRREVEFIFHQKSEARTI